jgi:hypothetical protein
MAEGRGIGTMTVSKELHAKQLHPMEVEEARVYGFWKPKRRGDGKEKNGFRIIISETRGHMLSP